MAKLCDPCRLAVLAVLLAAVAHGYLLYSGQDISRMAWTWPLLSALAAKWLTGDTTGTVTPEPEPVDVALNSTLEANDEGL